MSIDWSQLPIAFAGGFLCAALGANAGFIFTGVFVLIGVAVAAAGGGSSLISGVAFGPLLGPHVCFAGGAAAAAYAASRGVHDTGRDIGRGLAGLDRLDVLMVGGLFGMLGFLLNAVFGLLGLSPWTDTIALTVAVSAIVARLAFGKTGLLGARSEPGSWLPYQQQWPTVALYGAGLGLTSAYLAQAFGVAKGGDVVGFGFAATSLVFLHFGTQTPVWHHIALPAAIAFGLSGNIYIGAAAGVGGALCGEAYARLFLIHGDTHIDPPACAIATMTLVLRVLAAGHLL